MKLNSPSILVVARLLSAALMLVFAVLVASSLGPEGRGLTAFVFSLQAVLPSLLAFGLPYAIRRRLTIASPNTEIGGAVVLAAATSPIALTIAAIFLNQSFFSLEGNERFLYFLLIGSSTLSIVSRSLRELLLVEGKFFRQALVLLAQPLGMNVSLVFINFWSSISVSSVFFAQLIGTCLMWLAVGLATRVVPRLGVPKGQFREGLTYYVKDIVESLREKLDQLIALPLLGAATAGIYSIGAVIGFLPAIVAQSVGQTNFSEITSRVNQSSQKITGSNARVSLALTFAFSTILAILTPFLVTHFLGTAFAESIPLAVVFLFLHALPNAIKLVCDFSLNALGMGTLVSKTEAIGLFVGVSLAMAFVPFLGLWGLVLGILTDKILVAAALGRLSIRKFVYLRYERADLERLKRHFLGG